MEWKAKSFCELSNEELYEILKLRQEVFIIEQNCLYLDIDGTDKIAIHFSLYNNVELAAYFRCFPPMSSQDSCVFGRLLVKSQYRNRHYANSAVKFWLQYRDTHFPNTPIEISAQFYLKKFYEALGFTTSTESYDLDGIEHITMIHK